MYNDRLITEPTKRTPWIILEPGRIFIMGRSIPDNPAEFYHPLFTWISAYSRTYTGKSKIEFGFEYINSSSTKWIYSILRELSESVEFVRNADVTWYYEQGDEDMCELGFILRTLIDCPFLVVEARELNRSVYEMILAGQK